VIEDGLRIVGSAQTNRAMEAELVRITKKLLRRRPDDPRRDGTGQLAYTWDAEIAAAALTYHRTSTRIVRDLYASSARRLEPLYEELVDDVRGDARVWHQGLASISVEVRRVEAFAAGERQVVGTVKNAIVDGLSQRGTKVRVDAYDPDALVVARLDDRGRMLVGLDLTKGTRTRRGWRTEAGEAPLREHVAAVMAIEARYDPRKDLVVDPMCGAGTIAIEAALAARGAPVAAGDPSPALWPDARPVVVAGDVDLDVLVAARHNAQRAGVEVIFQRGDLRTDQEGQRQGRGAPAAAGADGGDFLHPGDDLRGADVPLTGSDRPTRSSPPTHRAPAPPFPSRRRGR
jgi:23S rRNA G2445 N2-methylase RlmL